MWSRHGGAWGDCNPMNAALPSALSKASSLISSPSLALLPLAQCTPTPNHCSVTGGLGAYPFSHFFSILTLIRVFSHIVHFRKILKVCGCIGSQTRNESIAWSKHALPRIYHLLTLPILCCWPRKLSLRRSLMTTGKWIFRLFFWKPY